MNSFLQFLNTVENPGIGVVIIAVLVLLAAGFQKGWMKDFITALNSLNTPWIALLVVTLGMVYNLKCKAFGLSSDSANQVIGGGLGLLTGQALTNKIGTAVPTPPAGPATDKETK
jgi:hypothetical protein